MRFALAWIVIAALPRPARADTLTLAQAIDRVRAQHPDVLRARAQMMQARARAGVALAEYLPSAVIGVLARGDFSNFTPVVVGTPQGSTTDTTFPFTGSYRYSAALTVNQLLFDGGQTLGALAAARAQLAAATSDLQTQLQSVEGAVTAAYLALLDAQAQAEVLRDYETQLRSLTQATRNLVRAGVRPEFDALSAETRALRATLDRVRGEAAVGRRRAVLIAALGLDEDAGFTVAEVGLAPGTEDEAPVERLLDEARRTRPELKAQAAMVRAAEAQLRATRGAYFPSLRLGLSALMTGNQDVKGPLYNFYGSLILEEELFSGLSTYRGAQAAGEAVRAARAQASAGLVAVRASIADAVVGVGAARAGVTQTELLLQQAQRLAHSAQRRYEAGLLSFLELMDAHGQRLIAQGQRASARYALDLARADLRRALGRSLSEPGGGR